MKNGERSEARASYQSALPRFAFAKWPVFRAFCRAAATLAVVRMRHEKVDGVISPPSAGPSRRAGAMLGSPRKSVRRHASFRRRRCL